MPFSTADIADAVASGLQHQAEADDAEQAVYGFDIRSELELHPLIQQSLTAAGFGVYPEQRYPDHRQKRYKSHGKRCDIVLTDGPPLRDPLVKNTLFDNAPAADPEDAYFLEIKTVAQFEIEGPFRRYSSELLGVVANDIKKLSRDLGIVHAGLLLVLFTQDQAVAEHDVRAWLDRTWKKKFPVQPPAMRGFPIRDRVGNAWCQVAVFNVKGGR